MEKCERRITWVTSHSLRDFITFGKLGFIYDLNMFIGSYLRVLSESPWSIFKSEYPGLNIFTESRSSSEPAHVSFPKTSLGTLLSTILGQNMTRRNTLLQCQICSNAIFLYHLRIGQKWSMCKITMFRKSPRFLPCRESNNAIMFHPIKNKMKISPTS